MLLMFPPCSPQADWRISIISKFAPSQGEVESCLARKSAGSAQTQVGPGLCELSHHIDVSSDYRKHQSAETVLCRVIDCNRVLNTLRAVHYNGFLGIVYEGKEDETQAIPRCVRYMRQVMRV